MKTRSPSPVPDLRKWLAESASRCRAQRWFGALFRFGVAEDITADVATHETAARIHATAAARHDREAQAEIAAARHELEAALSGGLDRTDVAAVRAAIRRLKRAATAVRRSEQRDNAAASFLATA